MKNLALNDPPPSLAVYASPLPFSNKRVKAFAAPGSSIQEIIDLTVPAEVREYVDVHVLINGHLVNPEYWHVIHPKMGSITNINVMLRGGGGKKNPLAMILSIAVAIAAPGIGAAFGTNLGLAVIGNGVLTAAQTAFFNGLVSAAVGVVGKLVVSAIAPPPTPSNAGSTSNPASSPTQFIEGATNSISPFGVVPICLGTNRMVPLQAARPYTEVVGKNQFIRQLFLWGYGNVVLSPLQIGDTDISAFDNFQVKHRLNGDLHLSTSLYTKDVSTAGYNILMQQADGFTIRTTELETDEAIVDVLFPQGLFYLQTSPQKRVKYRVQLEVQYSPAGMNDWSPAVSTYKSVAATTKSFAAAEISYKLVDMGGTDYYVGYRRDLVVLDKYTALISVVSGDAGGINPLRQPVTNPDYARAPALPPNKIRLSTVLIRTRKAYISGVVTTNIESITDDRSSAVKTANFQNPTDFLVTIDGNDVDIAAGALKINELDIIENQTSAVLRSARIIFPAPGEYDIRLRRLTPDTVLDSQVNKVYWIGLKSIRYQSPVTLEGISGTAVRIKATDQLNGSLDQLNAVVSNVIPDYNAALDTWTPKITSNPASIYRYVLQCAANSKALPDNKIDLDMLQTWHTHCLAQGYTYNRVIDYETTVNDILRDVASAGSASPAIVDGKRSVIIDMIKDDIVQVITPRNSWGYSGRMEYPDPPHAFRVQFRNADKGYVQDERIVYADGYNESNATMFEVLEYQNCTDPALAYMHARRFLAMIVLRPEVHTFMMDIEHLTAIRGDRVVLEHDVPIIGIGDGRIKTVSDNGTNVTGFTIDDVVTIPTGGTYYTRIRLADGTQLYKELVTTIGETNTFVFAVPFAIADTPEVGDLCYFVEAGGELDLVITRIEPQEDLSARITAVNYAPEIFTAESGPIPDFESNITTPLEFTRPLPPILVEAQSDENVMLLNSDGSITPRAVFTLENPNDGLVITNIMIRSVGTDTFTNANVLESTPERVAITGLEDGSRYDIHIRYKRVNGNVYSVPLELNNFLYVGASSLPDDVENFLVSISNNLALFTWDKNENIDLSHYTIKFSAAYTGVTWGTAQILAEKVYTNSLTTPFLGGTYLIKAIDLSGNESVNAATIVTYDPGDLRNVIEVLTEDPTFAGAKDNVELDGSAIVLDDVDADGYYYFDNDLDLGAVYVSTLAAKVIAGGTFVNDVYEMDDVFDVVDMYGSGGDNDLFLQTDIFAMNDVYGIGTSGWMVQLEYRVTNDDPSGTPTWSAWTPFVTGELEFRAIQFRILLRSLEQNISPRVRELAVTIDMPDRIESQEDLFVPAAGVTVTFDPPYLAVPAVVITRQNGATDDRNDITAKSASGFTIRVYNATAAGYVDRNIDWIANGYGREQ